MPRKLRVEYPGAVYHVMSRGNRRQAIYLDDVDRQEFEQRMEARRLEPGEEEGLKDLRRGWCVGGADFRRRMLERMEGRLAEHHSGELRRE